MRRNSAFKHETPFKGPYKVVQTWTNGKVTLRVGAITPRKNIRSINPYNTENVELRSLLKSKQKKKKKFIYIYIYVYIHGKKIT